ncbi:MAG: hypothetical protein F4X79_10665, partial [Acidobacteria bacterium]|nr:hypothetical protein [Acidobacteriota bacterium]
METYLEPPSNPEQNGTGKVLRKGRKIVLDLTPKTAPVQVEKPSPADVRLRRAASVAVFVFAVCDSPNPAAPPPALAPAPEPVPVRTPGPPLGEPANIRVVDRGQDFIVWEWDPVEGATSYQANVFPSGTPSAQRPPLVLVAEPALRADGLKPGLAYTLFVRAVRETDGGLERGPWPRGARGYTVPPQETRSIERGPLAACEDQRQAAQDLHSHPVYPNPVTHAWDTTPFRVYVEPEFSDEVREQVARFAWKLEYRLGYPILEGEVTDDPDDADIHVRFEQAVMDRGSRASANSRIDPPTVQVAPEGADDEDNRRAMIEHEVSHLFGFEHNQTCSNGRGVGVEMSPSLSCYFDGERTGRGAAEEDIDNIGCVFPHPDFP